MTPPTEYFRRCDADTPGAQRVGFEWFAWVDQDSLSRALNDGMLLGITIISLDDSLDASDIEIQQRVEELEKELEEERA